MSKKVLTLAAIVLVFSVCELEAAVTHSTWVGGEQGLWKDASNWSPRIVPDNTDWQTFVVTIDGNSIGVDEVEVYLQEDRTINRLDCYGEVCLETSTPFRVILTLADAGGLTNYGNLLIAGQGHQMEINANLTNASQARLGMSRVEINGNLYNSTGATIEVEYENDVEGDLQNDGNLIIIPASDILVEKQFKNTKLIKLYDGECSGNELFDNGSDGVITGSGTIWSEQLIQNKGTICASAGSLLLHSKGSITNTGTLKNDVGATLHIQTSVADVNNQGIIQINAAGATVFDCNLVNEPNGIIELLGGTLAATTITQATDAIFAGFGGITGDVVLEPNASIKLTGPTNIVGDVNIPAGATLEISDGQTLITGHTTNNGEIRVVNGKVVFQGGYSGSGIVKKE